MQAITKTSTLKESQPRRRPQKISLEDKKQFYHHWKKSGLSRNKFCREHKLTLASFCSWVNRFEAEARSSVSVAPSSSAFVPLAMMKTTVPHTTDLGIKQTVEMTLPNGFVCSFSGVLDAHFMAQLIQELAHGIRHSQS